jgi:hypothetical protein
VIVIAIGAFVLALDPDSKVLDLVAYAWAGFGASFGPTILASLYWRRMSLAGAYAGVLVGGITVVAWKSLSGGIFDLYEIVPGVVLSALAVAVFGRIGPPAPMPEKWHGEHVNPLLAGLRPQQPDERDRPGDDKQAQRREAGCDCTAPRRAAAAGIRSASAPAPSPAAKPQMWAPMSVRSPPAPV